MRDRDHAASASGTEEALRRIAICKTDRSEDLDLGGLALQDVPEEILELTWLKRLYLGLAADARKKPVVELSDTESCNAFRALPNALSSALPHLEELDCSYTEVTDLTPLTGLTALQNLDCYDTKVDDLTPLTGMTALQSLDCSVTKVADLTPLTGLTALQSLACFSTKVADLTPLTGLTALQSLACFSTKVADLTPLKGLTALKSLSCSGTKVDDLTPLTGMTALQSLDCSVTKVADLTPLKGLTSLQSFEFFETPVADLAPLTGLTALQSLVCSDTKVTDLTPLSGLTALRRLVCCEAQIEVPPPHHVWMGNALENLHLFRTSIPGIPSEVLSSSYGDNCLDSLRAHLADLGDTPVEMTDAKLMILGNGRVGKTQVLRRLRGAAFEENADSTHGILVADLPVPERAAGDPARFHVWDFGGQDIYHGTHALFLRSRAVFIICWTPEMEDSATHEYDGLRFRNYPLAYWLDHVRQFAGVDAPVLVVQTQCDEIKDERGLPEAARDALEAFSGFKRALHTSAREGHGFASLKEALNRAYTYFNPPLIGPGRASVKAQIEAWQAEDSGRPANKRKHQTLSYTAYRQLCERTGTVSDPAMLLKFLHNAGTVFHRDGILHDKIILDQQWALEAIYAVFHRELCYRALKNAGGRFNRQDLGLYLWDATYSLEEQRLFLSMMQSCGICFAHRTAHDLDPDTTEYIAPELLPAGRPGHVTRLWEVESEREREIEFACDVLPETLIRGIISKIGQRAGIDGDYWASGLSVFEAGSGTHILIEQMRSGPDSWGGRIVLRLRPQDDSSTLSPVAVELLVETIEREAARFGISLDIEGDEMRARLRSAQEEPALAFSQPGSDVPECFVSYAWADDKTPEGRDREAGVDRLCEAYEGRGIHIIRDKANLGFGDSIPKFMKRIGGGDRVFVFLSDKYLTSPNCMFELSEIWRTARRDDDAFMDRVRVFTVGTVDIWSPAGRLTHAAHWEAEFERFNGLVKEHGAHLLPEKDQAALRRMREFAHSTGDILSTIADRVQPRDFDGFLKWGFDDPPNEGD
ncbi:leucine-rich repeat domain-containing protein [Stappia stellulata]|uniref:leucine-rich repeat domain-containing protein n=1 Tax=Stappia stellulata TaxID=71235 RepID=UPI0003F887EB|nr:leucine-rich repeat domain-containing protein [Stappia stellulata]